MSTDFIAPPQTHQDAKDILAEAYREVLDTEPSQFALGIAQAIGLMEGGYGANFGNNWGAITRAPNQDGSCPADSFVHGDSSFELGEYQTCFRKYDSSLEGAADFLRTLYVQRPTVYDAALDGDIRRVAEEMYRTNYYLGTAPSDQKDENGAYTNVNNYIAFIGKGVEDIADLYTPEPASSSSGGIAWVLGGAAVLGVIAAVKS